MVTDTLQTIYAHRVAKLGQILSMMERAKANGFVGAASLAENTTANAAVMLPLEERKGHMTLGAGRRHRIGYPEGSHSVFANSHKGSVERILPFQRMQAVVLRVMRTQSEYVYVATALRFRECGIGLDIGYRVCRNGCVMLLEYWAAARVAKCAALANTTASRLSHEWDRRHERRAATTHPLCMECREKQYPMTTLALDKRVVLTLLLSAQFAVRKLHGSFSDEQTKTDRRVQQTKHSILYNRGARQLCFQLLDLSLRIIPRLHPTKTASFSSIRRRIVSLFFFAVSLTSSS